MFWPPKYQKDSSEEVRLGLRKLGFSREFLSDFQAVFNCISADFGRLSVVIGMKRKRGKFCVLSKIVFYEFLEEEGK